MIRRIGKYVLILTKMDPFLGSVLLYLDGDATVEWPESRGIPTEVDLDKVRGL